LIVFDLCGTCSPRNAETSGPGDFKPPANFRMVRMPTRGLVASAGYRLFPSATQVLSIRWDGRKCQKRRRVLNRKTSRACKGSGPKLPHGGPIYPRTEKVQKRKFLNLLRRSPSASDIDSASTDSTTRALHSRVERPTSRKTLTGKSIGVNVVSAITLPHVFLMQAIAVHFPQVQQLWESVTRAVSRGSEEEPL